MVRPFHILVLCTGNSARSIIGEALVTHYGDGKVKGFSAGSAPAGHINPTALETLTAHGHPREEFRSKSWDVFAGPKAVPIDMAITVCDNAAAERCPAFLGAPLRVHWGVPDPAHIEPEAARRAAFERVYKAFAPAVKALTDLIKQDIGGAVLQEAAVALAPKEIGFD